MTREEAIREARRKLDAGDFQRAVVKSEPEDLHYDRRILECGHTTVWLPRITRLLDHPEPLVEQCEKCAADWIMKNTDGKKRGGAEV